jgi:hypothetical protein
MNNIKYFLIQNKLNTSSGIAYLPRTVLNGSLSGKSLVETICWGSTITPSDCMAVMENLERVVAEQLSQGRSVNLGFVILKPTVKGSFQSPEETFSLDKHQIAVTVTGSMELQRKVSRTVQPIRIASSKSAPLLTSWANISDRGNSNVRIGSLIEIRGQRLNFAEKETNQGVFFTKEDGTNIRGTEYSRIANGLVGMKVPEGLNPGESYNVEVRALFGTNLRTGKLDDSILIE